MRIERMAVILLLAAAPAAAAPKVCGLASGRALSTFQDSIEAAGTNLPLAAALAQIGSFPDVQALIAGTPGRVCVSAIPLSKNIYQYYRYLVVLSFGDDGKAAAAPMIFQAASVQAYENAGPKPWLGVDRDVFARQTAALLAGVEFHEAQGSVASPADLLPKIFPGDGKTVDPTSRAYALLPDADAAWTTYLVSQLRFIDTGNPFTSTYIEDTGIVQVQEAAGRVRWGRITADFFGAETALEEAQGSSKPAESRDARAQRLIELSRGAAGRAPATTPTLDAARRGVDFN